ncbi:MAG TPA: GGDEF domain-containing protein [Candidatus Eremiobacteraceae bacterium]|nr:GGDEF domain-containing protein [Candidatus Eremiobacteraceae bacterium]
MTDLAALAAPIIDTRFRDLFQLTSVISLVFQISVTALIALVSFIVSRAVRRGLFPYWASGWACYTCSLVAILLANRVTAIAPVFYFAYFFFEYAAIVFIFAACRHTAGTDLPSGRVWSTLVPAAIVAIVLVGFPTVFLWRYTFHNGILGFGWAACLVALLPALRERASGPGVRLTAAGLALLSLDYLQHCASNWYLHAQHVALSPYYYTVTSLIDGMFELMLGFGSVVVIVDRVRAELAAANEGLRVAHDRTASALNRDALTGALSRYSFEHEHREAEKSDRRGTIVVVDLDGLKQINDSLGHATGDAAIRAVARGLADLVRGEDKVYRLGGDEFVVVMPGMPLELARSRMQRLDDAINARMEPGSSWLTVSHGLSEFTGDDTESALTAADAAMYAEKSGRKAAQEKA